MDVKVCKNCMQVNPLENETCSSCEERDFDDIQLTPLWDSIEAYQEEE